MADQTTTYADRAGRYRLDDRIATGGMGEVWRATDTVLDRRVAVKLLKQEHADEPVFRSRFETEARHAAGLHHPGVAQVYDFGSGDEHSLPFLVMEYVEGQPLSALLRPGESMDPAAVSSLLAAAGDALGAAHLQGIVHRDVKPGNLLVTPDRQVKVTDFGIARATGSVALTRTGEVLGTPQYISPEQAEGRPATPASDVYSLGAVGFECLAGRRPFVAETPVATALAHLRQPVPELPAAVPADLAGVVRRAMAKDPAERYGDGAAFAAAIRGAAGSLTVAPTAPMALSADDTASTRVLTPPPAVPEAPAAAAGGWRERARAVPLPLWAVAGVLVVVVAIAAFAAATDGGGSPAPTTGHSHTPSTPATTSGTTLPSPSGPTHTPTATDHGHHGNQGGQGDQGNGNGKAKGHRQHGEGD
jgi:eukaryotic-like serine/threonine-protein kinase